MEGRSGVSLDYIHGAEVVEELTRRPKAIGFLLPPMKKEELFPTVIHDGVLPRKTFSMGEAHDKRFYLEARKSPASEPVEVRTMERFAPAKLNLTLDVLGKRPDGYHDLKMVMQSITLGIPSPWSRAGEGVRVQTDLHFLPTGPKNLAAAAASRFYETLGRPVPGLEISIRKRIPVCAGMAGSSTDAAAVLGPEREGGNPFSMEELARVGEGVGSDVPYCVLGGTALAEGGGDTDPLTPLPRCWVAVCKPDFPVSTPELFARIDGMRVRCRPDTAGLLAALAAGTCLVWPDACTTCLRKCCRSGRR